MKVLVAICLVAAIIYTAHASEEDKQKAKELYKKCVDKTGVDKELVSKARAGEFVENDKLTQYVHCMFVNLGFMNEDGTLHPDVMKAKLPETVDKAKAGPIIEKCITHKDDVVLHRALSLFKCFRTEINQDVRLF